MSPIGAFVFFFRWQLWPRRAASFFVGLERGSPTSWRQILFSMRCSGTSLAKTSPTNYTLWMTQRSVTRSVVAVVDVMNEWLQIFKNLTHSSFFYQQMAFSWGSWRLKSFCALKFTQTDNKPHVPCAYFGLGRELKVRVPGENLWFDLN